MSTKSNNRVEVTIAAGGDVGTGHKQPESAFTHVLEPLRAADIGFVEIGGRVDAGLENDRYVLFDCVRH